MHGLALIAAPLRAARRGQRLGKPSAHGGIIAAFAALNRRHDRQNPAGGLACGQIAQGAAGGREIFGGNRQFGQQLLGFGEILNEVREYYIEFGNIEDEVFWEIDLENQLRDWTALGPQGFPDEKYAAVAYMYMKFVREGLENPISALAEFMNCEKNTASSRVMEARARGLLSKPKVGTYGGKLTSKYEQIIKKPTPKGEKGNAKKGK